MKLEKMTRTSIATLTLIGSLIGGVNAAVVSSSDSSLFNLTNQPFNPTALTLSNITSISGDVTLIPAVAVGDPLTEEHVIRDYTPTLTGLEYVLTGDENFDVSFSSPQRVFAFDYTDDSVVSLFTLDFFDGATTVGSSSFVTSSPFDTQNFIAFTSDVDFDRVAIRESDGSANSNEAFQFYTATAVPEPSSTLLLGLGSLGLAFRRARR